MMVLFVLKAHRRQETRLVSMFLVENVNCGVCSWFSLLCVRNQKSSSVAIKANLRFTCFVAMLFQSYSYFERVGKQERSPCIL